MIILILILIYILSIIGNRWIFRLYSYKHFKLWSSKYCRISLAWVFPGYNTLHFIIHLVLLLTDEDVEIIKLPKSKLFNTDL